MAGVHRTHWRWRCRLDLAAAGIMHGAGTSFVVWNRNARCGCIETDCGQPFPL